MATAAVMRLRRILVLLEEVGRSAHNGRSLVPRGYRNPTVRGRSRHSRPANPRNPVRGRAAAASRPTEQPTAWLAGCPALLPAGDCESEGSRLPFFRRL